MRVWAQCGLLALLMLASTAYGQSVAEAARQEQARKSAAPQAQHVYTNEDFPAHAVEVAPASEEEKDSKPAEAGAAPKGSKKPTAEELRAKILAQKQKVRALEARIAEIQKRLDERENTLGNVSVYEKVILQGRGIGTGPGFCAAVTLAPYRFSQSEVEWCNEPAKLTAEKEKKQADLDKERAVLEQMQEEARRLGYRSAVYDPD